jgi:hypothetical protein
MAVLSFRKWIGKGWMLPEQTPQIEVSAQQHKTKLGLRPASFLQHKLMHSLFSPVYYDLKIFKSRFAAFFSVALPALFSVIPGVIFPNRAWQQR